MTSKWTHFSDLSLRAEDVTSILWNQIRSRIEEAGSRLFQDISDLNWCQKQKDNMFISSNSSIDHSYLYHDISTNFWLIYTVSRLYIHVRTAV